MKYLFQSIFLLFFLSVVRAQIFIPIIIPTGTTAYTRYNCGTSNKKAIDYMQKGIDNLETNIDAALVYFKGAIKVDSLFCDAYDFSADVFMMKEEYDSAMKYINHSLNVNSANRWASKTKVRLHFIMREYEKAGDYAYSQHLKQPDDGIWYYYLAESLLHRDLLDSAKNVTLKMQMI